MLEKINDFLSVAIAILCVAICLLALSACVFEDCTPYEAPAIVEEVNDDYCVLVDWNGEAWECEADLEVGQLVIVKFNPKGTESIYDDEILGIRG